MCRRAYPQEILIQFFSLRVRPFLNLEIWPNWKILLKQFVSATLLKALNRISWKFVVVKDIPSRYAYPHEILTQFFFSELCPFELRNLAKMRDTTQKQVVSTTPLKPLNRISWNFVAMKDIMCRYAYPQEMLIWSF